MKDNAGLDRAEQQGLPQISVRSDAPRIIKLMNGVGKI